MPGRSVQPTTCFNAVIILLEDDLDQGQLGRLTTSWPFSRSSRRASRGAKAFKELIAAIRTAFPEIRWVIEKMMGRRR